MENNKSNFGFVNTFTLWKSVDKAACLSGLIDVHLFASA